MAQPTISEFVDCLGSSHLLTDIQFKRLKQQLTGNPLDAEGLAQVLVRQKHLTQWQAGQLLKGQTGFVLNQYRLLSPVGRGGMGHVFRALDVSRNQVVAVKVMARKLTGNETLVSRFQREIRASSELNSPYIVRTLDAGRVEKVDFMVMEFVNGDQVDRIANRLGRIPTGLACGIIRQVAEGLQHAHENKMVHRDIKPSNMMVHWDESGTGTAKLMDMGLVLVMSEGEDRSVTRTGQVMGTPDYMSPEQGWDTTQVDIRSDIYSLGCTLFRLLTGRTPFTGSNPVQVLSQRLQRDAPSVRTICDDIPDDVAAVVARMTLRDPDERYQTPAEVAAALEQFAEPLLKNSFQAAAQAATNDVTESFSDPRSDEVDETDGTYQQFLAEVDKGSVVDLMLTTDAAASPEANTVAVPEINIQSENNSSVVRKRPRPRRGFRTAVVTSVLSLCALIVILVIAFGPGSSDESDQVITDVQSPPVAEVPIGRFVPAEEMASSTGEKWTFLPKTETDNVTGSIKIELGDTAPVGIELDQSSGQLTWVIPAEQSAGVYSIPIRLVHAADDNRVTLDETTLKVNVSLGRAAVRLPQLPPLELDADQLFTETISVDSSLNEAFDLKYRLNGAIPDGLKIDTASGTLTWTPSAISVGRHSLRAEVFAGNESKPLDQTDVTLFVLPSRIEHVLPELPQQTATPGKTFQYLFPGSDSPLLARNRNRRLLRVADPQASDFTISPDSSMLVWEVPSDAEGIVKVPLSARIELGGDRRSRNLKGTRILEIKIVAATPPAPTNRMPPADQIEAALTELRDTYKQRLAAARLTPQKTHLAWQLLELTFDAAAAASDAALLQLIEDDLANRSRAIDVLFRIGTIRAERYGTNELDAALKAVDLHRRSTLDAEQQDTTVEEGLRLALGALETDNFNAANKLLELVASLLRGTGGQGVAAQLATDVEHAAELASELAKDPKGTTSSIKTQELKRILTRWQFRQLFSSGAGVSHFGVSATGAGGVNGRQLWKIEKGTARLEADTRQAAVGFLDAAARGRYVLRANLAPSTTSAQFVIGAVGSTDADFSAYGIVLDATAPGRIIDLRNRMTVAEPTATVRLYSDRSNRVEVLVDGTDVLVRINATTVSQARISELQEGRIGVAASLGTPEPKVLLRDIRLLTLPDAP